MRQTHGPLRSLRRRALLVREQQRRPRQWVRPARPRPRPHELRQHGQPDDQLRPRPTLLVRRHGGGGRRRNTSLRQLRRTHSSGWVGASRAAGGGGATHLRRRRTCMRQLHNSSLVWLGRRERAASSPDARTIILSAIGWPSRTTAPILLPSRTRNVHSTATSRTCDSAPTIATLVLPSHTHELQHSYCHLARHDRAPPL
jgi:hypothetical protein